MTFHHQHQHHHAMHLYLSSVSASKMLRRRIPQSGHLMTAKKFWLQTVPCNVSDTTMDQMHSFSSLAGLWHCHHLPSSHWWSCGGLAPRQAQTHPWSQHHHQESQPLQQQIQTIILFCLPNHCLLSSVRDTQS